MNPPINDGGPAFAVPDSHYPNGQVQFGCNGMTLRDWFAGQCDPSLYRPLETFSEAVGRKPNTEELAQWLAQIRLVEADAMLAARNQQPEKP